AGPPPSAASQPAPPVGVRINSGDLLDISVYGVPDLAQRARVGNNGDAYLNLLGYVHLDGLTIEQSQALLEQKFVDGGFLKNPHVAIMVAEYASGVSLMGEVSRPGIYPVLGTRRLYDILAAAGGVTPTAGRTVTITHRDSPQDPVTITMSPDPKLAAQ